MLASDDVAERDFAIKQILHLRGDNKLGDLSVRIRRVPKINAEARTLEDLLDWIGEDIYEPVFTCHITCEDLVKIKDKKCQCMNSMFMGKASNRWSTL